MRTAPEPPCHNIYVPESAVHAYLDLAEISPDVWVNYRPVEVWRL